MEIIKKINNSAVVAIDSSGREVVALGKGIGFPKVPYILDDLSVIERTYYDIDDKYLPMITNISNDILLVCGEIAEEAEIELECVLNPNLPLTLADHLNFAVERMEKGIDLIAPIAYDISHLYSKEYNLGKYSLDLFYKSTGIQLPEVEAVNIALHLINAQAQSGNVKDFVKFIQIIEKIDVIIEKSLQFKLDKESYNYSRFLTHMRYLVQRLESGTKLDNEVTSLKKSLMKDYPDVYICVLEIQNYFKKEWNWTCYDDEIVYLMIHIQRVYNKI